MNLNRYFENTLLFKIAYFLFAFLEIYAQFTDNNTLLWLSKPFIIPSLIALYFFTSREVSYFYVIALLFNWTAGMLFFATEMKIMLTLASLSFLVYRILILVTILKKEKRLGFVSILLGTIPFSFFYLCLINLIYDNISGGGFCLIVFQAVSMSLLGGIALGNYMVNNTFSSKIFMISALFFAINLFGLGVRFYFIDLLFLKPISFAFFVFGEYLFYNYLILKEKRISS